MSIEIAKEARQQAIASIERYFNENMDEKIGNIAAGALLGFFLEEIGPIVYNKAVAAWPEIFDSASKRKFRATILADAGGEYISAGDGAMALKKTIDSLKEWPWHRARFSLAVRLLTRRLLGSHRSVNAGA